MRNRGPISLLLVDDDPQVLSALRRSITMQVPRNWTIHAATSAEAAIQLFERISIDVVISDLRMPRVSGPTLLAMVRDRWPATFRVILSGGGYDHDAALGATDVAHRFLAKPCPAAELLAALAGLIDARMRTTSAPPFATAPER